MKQALHRLNGLSPYVLAAVHKMEALDSGEESVALHLRSHLPLVSRGIPPLCKPLSHADSCPFNIQSDTEKSVLVTLDSQEGFSQLTSALKSLGNMVLVSNHPIHACASGFVISGRTVQNIPVTSAVLFLEDFYIVVFFLKILFISRNTKRSLKNNGFLVLLEIPKRIEC